MTGARTVPFWFESSGAPVAAWLSEPVAGPTDVGLVVVPPLAYEYWTTFRSVRTLAESCAESGISVLRFDLPGTGSSAGTVWDDDLVAAWRLAIADGVATLRRRGCLWVGLAGLRAGALLALTSDVAAEATVAWLPVVNGARYVRQLRLLGTAEPESQDRPEVAGGIVSAGVGFSRRTLDAIASLRAGTAAGHGGVLVAAPADDKSADELAEAAARIGREVTRIGVGDGASMLQTSTEAAAVDELDITTLTRAIRDLAPPPAAASPNAQLEDRVTLTWGSGRIAERFATVGRHGLAAVVGEPATAAASTIVMFLNPGAEHSIGPGRAWVEFSRTLNLSGVATARIDFRGWGESPPAPSGGPGHPYAEHAVDDVRDMAAAFHQQGFERVVAVGLCASSWVALHAVSAGGPLDGVFALNVPLFWGPDIPWHLTVAEGAEFLAEQNQRNKRFADLGVWRALDLVGYRPRGARLLRTLADSGVSIDLVYAEGDLGIRYIRERLAGPVRRAMRSGTIRLIEIPDIDHQMHREWLRPAIGAALLDYVSRGEVRRGSPTLTTR